MFVLQKWHKVAYWNAKSFQFHASSIWAISSPAEFQLYLNKNSHCELDFYTSRLSGIPEMEKLKKMAVEEGRSESNPMSWMLTQAAREEDQNP